jgi:hypothetical protein
MLVQFILHSFLPTTHIHAILLGGHWTRADLGSLSETVQYIREQGGTPIVLGPVVEYDASLPRLLAMSIQNSEPDLAQRHRVASVERLDDEMARLAAEEWHVEYFSYFKALCSGGRCREYAAPGVPLQEDTSHLTRAGSLWIAARLRAVKIVE